MQSLMERIHRGAGFMEGVVGMLPKQSVATTCGIAVVLGALWTGACTHAGADGHERAAAATIPFSAALDGARIVEDRLDNVLEHSLILGNGDVNAVLHGKGEQLVLRLSKNDVWDARVDTSRDPPLMKVDIPRGTWTPGGVPPSWEKPYPCPRACGLIVLGAGTASETGWECVRAEGATNHLEFRNGAAVMSLAGTKGASNGFAYGPLDVSTDRYRRLRVKVSGTRNAKYFVEVDGVFSSLWQKTPMEPEERVFDLPAGRTVRRVILYTWTEDGAPAENRFAQVQLEGSVGALALDLKNAAPTTPKLEATLDLRRAAARVKQKQGETVVRALAQRNVFLLETPLEATLAAVPASYLPAAQTGSTEGVRWLTQQLPGDPDWPGMSFAVALAEQGTRKAVAVVTSLEAQDFLAAAIRLAKWTLAEDTAALVRQHERTWEAFWAASGVDLSDRELTAMWYRNLYFFRCVSKPGVEAIGLYAGLAVDDPPWHGSHTLNYNSEQTFWPAYITNHVELAEPYERMVFRYLPRARWFARQTYDCDGAHFPHNVFTHEIADPETCQSNLKRMHAASPYAQTLGVSGWTVQNLWLHYRFQPDREYLEKIAYPAVRDVATFYAEFLDKCRNDSDGKAQVGPSYCPEHRGMGVYNCVADLAFMRFALAAARDGAKALGRDAELAERFSLALARLPAYPATHEAEPMLTDVKDGAPLTYNVAVPVLPVFPADQVTWFSSQAEKALLRRTIERVKWDGYNSSIIMSVARARLSLPGTAAWVKNEMLLRSRPNGTITLRPGDRCGHFTEQFAAAGAVSELLLQSVGDVVRVFPAWPAEQSARFENLGTQGGFLISAEQSGGQVKYVKVTATAKGKLRLLSPWRTVRVLCNGKAVRASVGADGTIELEMRSGDQVDFTAS